MADVLAVNVSIKPQTPGMEAFLQAGYPDLSVAKAKLILKERRENPALWPFEQMQRAEAFLAAYEGVPLKNQVISTRQGPPRGNVEVAR